MVATRTAAGLGNGPDLLQQTVASTIPLTGGTYRIPSANSINWRPATGGSTANCTPTCTPTHMGWYIDLPSSKERTTGIPKLINNVIFFNTYIPSTAVCDAGGTGWLMSLDYLNGGLIGTHRVFDTSGNGIVDSSDTQVGGYQVGAVLGGTTLIQNDLTTSNIGVGVSATTSGNLSDNLINFGSGTSSSSVCTGRCSWREIIQ